MTSGKKTAIYIRLSSEDANVDGRNKMESDSVSAQRILLQSYVIHQLGVDERDILEYVDDGVTGTHFHRQSFQQLTEDMKTGEIDCIVVKDFSRFGRDYLEVGFYMEYIFPLLQIRFISINDNYDSAASVGMTGGMNVALKNLVYNMYSLDLSKKITSAMETRMKNGTRNPVQARFGYRKRKDGSIEIEPESAKIVKMIFEMAANGDSFAEITRELNRLEIPTCVEMKEAQGVKTSFQKFDTIKKQRWNATTVSGIVRDEIYIGTRIWGKSKCNMHTAHKSIRLDESEWIRLENQHDAIVDKELFEKANALHPKKAKGYSETRTNYTLPRKEKKPAFLVCGHCGHGLVADSAHRLKCTDGRTSGDDVCRKFVVKREILEENILAYVRQFANTMLAEKKAKNVSSGGSKASISELTKRSKQLSSLRMKFYDDYKNGKIDRTQYKREAEKLAMELEDIKLQIEEIQIIEKQASHQENEFLEEKLTVLANLDKFDKEKLQEVIKVVQVYDQDHIEIIWNFDDMFQKL